MPAPEETPFDEKKPEPAPVVTYEMVQNVAIKLVQEQRQSELRALLQKHGLQGLPELKQEASRFVKAFIGLDVDPVGCVPVCGSMQGTFASFLTCSQGVPDSRLLFS